MKIKIKLILIYITYFFKFIIKFKSFMNRNYIGKYESKFLFIIEEKDNIKIIDNENNIIATINHKQISSQYNLFLIGHCYTLDRIHFIFLAKTEDKEIKNIYSGLYDLKIKEYFPISLPELNITEIIDYIPIKDHTTIFEQNKIMFFGGFNIKEKSKIQKSCIIFDISIYKFEKIKYSEFTFIPRFKCGSTSQNGILYIIGGYTSLEQKIENITELVQFAKFYEGKLHKFNVAKIEKESPKEMINNSVFIVDDRYVVSFSGFNYCKLWIMDTKDNSGKNYDLRNFGIEGKNDENNFYECIQCDIKDEKNINLIIANLVNSKINIINNDIPY